MIKIGNSDAKQLFIGMDEASKAFLGMSKIYEKTQPGPSIEFVDLGLPSGKRWAKWNLGATNETEYGKYYAWGDTTGYTDGADGKFQQAWYNTLPAASISQNLTDDTDAATIELGTNYCLPTQEDINELANNTTKTWQTNYKGSSINGLLFASTNGNSIFIPASGYYAWGSLADLGTAARLWSKTYSNSSQAISMFMTSGGASASLDNRPNGYTLRAITK